MEKYYFEKELKEAVLIKNGDKPTAMVLNGKEVEVCCPELCSMNISEDGSPCLVSEDKISSDKKYEVVAFPLDYPNRENKDWICLEPIIFEDAVEYFLANHHMEEMVSGCINEKIGGNEKTGSDFIAGDANIQINVPDAILNAAGGGWMQIKSLMLTVEKVSRNKNIIAELKGTGKRMIFLTIFQHGFNEKMKDWLCRELSKYFAMDMDERVEFWQADFPVNLSDFQPVHIL